jgi:hypothetical protein
MAACAGIAVDLKAKPAGAGSTFVLLRPLVKVELVGPWSALRCAR